MTGANRIACVIAAVAAWVVAGCGGAGNPLGNPATVSNPGAGSANQKLAFAYFQKCINPIFLKVLPININGVVTNNTCASAGCHDNITGPGGALRIVGASTMVDLSNLANTPDVIRTTDMYKNYYSAQGSTLVGSTTQSKLIQKPLVQNVLHGGGVVFANDQDPNVKLLQYWITHPAPLSQDEFSTATYNMFTPPDPQTGTCNTQ